MNRKLLTIWILLSAIILASCGGLRAMPTTPQLPIPPALVLPKIQGAELGCLAAGVYRKLVVRDVMQKTRINTLEFIIKATHQ